MNKKDDLSSFINMEEALDIVEGDRELLKDMFTFFIEDTPEPIDGIREAISTSNFEQMYESAHKIKGMLKNISAANLAEFALKFEAMGRNKDLSGASELFLKFDKKYQLLMEALKGFETNI